jgi:hypothetical protein
MSRFFYSTYFTEANIDLSHMTNLTTTEEMFANCNHLTSVKHTIIKSNT